MSYKPISLEALLGTAQGDSHAPHEMLREGYGLGDAIDRSSNAFGLGPHAWVLVLHVAAVALNNPTQGASLKDVLRDSSMTESDYIVTKRFKEALWQIHDSPVEPYWRECGRTSGKKYWLVNDNTMQPEYRVAQSDRLPRANKKAVKESAPGSVIEDDDSVAVMQPKRLALDADNNLGVYSVYTHNKLGLWGVAALDYLAQNPDTPMTNEHIAQHLSFGEDDSVLKSVTRAIQTMRQDRFISPFLTQKKVSGFRLGVPQTQTSIRSAFSRRLYADLSVHEKRVLVELAHGPASAGPVELAEVFDAVKHTLQDARRSRNTVFNDVLRKLTAKYADHLSLEVPPTAGDKMTIEVVTIEKKLAQKMRANIDK